MKNGCEYVFHMYTYHESLWFFGAGVCVCVSVVKWGFLCHPMWYVRGDEYVMLKYAGQLNINCIWIDDKNFERERMQKITSIVGDFSHFTLLFHGSFLFQVAMIRHIRDDLGVLSHAQRFRIVRYLQMDGIETIFVNKCDPYLHSPVHSQGVSFSSVFIRCFLLPARLLPFSRVFLWSFRPYKTSLSDNMRKRHTLRMAVRQTEIANAFLSACVTRRLNQYTYLCQFAFLLLKVGMIFYIRLDFRVFCYSLQFGRICNSRCLGFRNMAKNGEINETTIMDKKWMSELTWLDINVLFAHTKCHYMVTISIHTSKWQNSILCFFFRSTNEKELFAIFQPFLAHVLVVCESNKINDTYKYSSFG